MSEVQILPSPRINPYAGENSKAVMSILNILASTEVARRKKMMTENILEAISRGGGRKEISAAALMEPGFSGGIPGLLQKIASPFAAQSPGIEDIIAGQGIESAFRPMGISEFRMQKYQETGDEGKEFDGDNVGPPYGKAKGHGKNKDKGK